MELIGTKVKHKSLGSGIIVSKEEDHIVVKFAEKNIEVCLQCVHQTQINERTIQSINERPLSNFDKRFS